jgi:predicted metal-dependent phosphoesterase TrpH
MIKIDLHIHSKDGSDGRWHLEEIFREASIRGINLISITDHDSISSQKEAAGLAQKYRMSYITGVELNVTFNHSEFTEGKDISLDFLGYNFDPDNKTLVSKLAELSSYRRKRALIILENLNSELSGEGKNILDEDDIRKIQERTEGAIGRPHIADYLIETGIVKNRQEAFDRYLVRLNLTKMHLSLEEASNLIRGAGGLLFLAHPDDPNGTSLRAVSDDLSIQQKTIESSMLDHIDGIECWHSRLTPKATDSYLAFARRHDLLVSGGSDCHQQPVLMGSLEIPAFVAGEFGINSF